MTANIDSQHPSIKGGVDDRYWILAICVFTHSNINYLEFKENQSTIKRKTSMTRAVQQHQGYRRGYTLWTSVACTCVNILQSSGNIVKCVLWSEMSAKITDTRMAHKSVNVSSVPVNIDQNKVLGDFGVHPKVHLSMKTLKILTLCLSFYAFPFVIRSILEERSFEHFWWEGKRINMKSLSACCLDY